MTVQQRAELIFAVRDEASANMAKIGKAGQAASQQLAQGTKEAEQAAGRADKATAAAAGNIQRDLLKVAGVATATAVALKKAFEFAREGAQIAQTTASFEQMLRVVGAAPDTLNQLRQAARGTVDDLSLMANVQTLLAGTSGTLASELATAAPQLMEMAKAANKINPTLGDTNFMFESIARGIKRNSPLILDNLGIVVKVGEANAAYAAKLGKTVAALTAEEKQLALLNAVLAQGDTLMAQAGNSAESATDSFERFDAATANLTNQLKALVGMAAVPLVNASAANVETINRANEAFAAGHINAAQYAATLIMTLTPLGLFTDELTVLNAEAAKNAHNQASVNRETQIAAQHYHQIQAAVAALRPEVVDYNTELSDTAHAYQRMGEAANAGMGEATAAIQAARAEAKKLSNATLQTAVNAGLAGTLTSAWSEYQTTIADTNTAIAELDASTDTYATSLAELEGKQIAAEEALRRTTAEFIFQQLAVEGDAEANLNLARNLGLLDEASYQASLAAQELKTAYEDGKFSAEQFGVSAGQLADAIGRLQSKQIEITVTTIFQEIHRQTIQDATQAAGGQGGGVSPGVYDPKPSGGGFGMATGADFVVPAGYPGDTFGPMYASSGERVTVQTPEQMRRGGAGGGVNIENITVTVGQGDAREISRQLAYELRSALENGAGALRS